MKMVIIPMNTGNKPDLLAPTDNGFLNLDCFDTTLLIRYSLNQQSYVQPVFQANPALTEDPDTISRMQDLRDKGQAECQFNHRGCLDNTLRRWSYPILLWLTVGDQRN